MATTQEQQPENVPTTLDLKPEDLPTTLELNHEDVLLNNEAMDEIHDIFLSFDLNGDGKISRKEITQVFGRLRIYLPQEVVQAAFKETDTDLSGDLDFDEFKNFIKALKVKDDEYALRKMFDELDVEKKGEISAQAAEELLVRFGHLRLDDTTLVKRILSKGIEGSVTFERFCQILSDFL